MNEMSKSLKETKFKLEMKYENKPDLNLPSEFE